MLAPWPIVCSNPILTCPYFLRCPLQLGSSIAPGLSSQLLPPRLDGQLHPSTYARARSVSRACGNYINTTFMPAWRPHSTLVPAPSLAPLPTITWICHARPNGLLLCRLLHPPSIFHVTCAPGGAVSTKSNYHNYRRACKGSICLHAPKATLCYPLIMSILSCRLHKASTCDNT